MVRDIHVHVRKHRALEDTRMPSLENWDGGLKSLLQHVHVGKNVLGCTTMGCTCVCLLSCTITGGLYNIYSVTVFRL